MERRRRVIFKQASKHPQVTIKDFDAVLESSCYKNIWHVLFLAAIIHNKGVERNHKFGGEKPIF